MGEETERPARSRCSQEILAHKFKFIILDSYGTVTYEGQGQMSIRRVRQCPNLCVEYEMLAGPYSFWFHI